MAAVWLNVMNVEFRNDVSREFEEIQSRKRGIAIAIVRTHNVRAKRIRRDADALAGMRGKSNVRLGIGMHRRARHTARDESASASRQSGELFQEQAPRKWVHLLHLSQENGIYAEQHIISKQTLGVRPLHLACNSRVCAEIGRENSFRA
jgi:hypothetical protein